MSREEYDYDDRTATMDAWGNDHEDEFYDDIDYEPKQSEVNPRKMDSYEKTRHWWSDGKFGLISGAILGAVSLVAHVIHTFVVNLLLGKHEQYALRDAFMRAFRGTPPELQNDKAEADGKDQQKEQQKEQKKETDKESGDKNKAPEQPLQEDKEGNKDTDKAQSKNAKWRPDPADVPEHLTNEAVEKMLNDDQIKDAFSRIGLGAEPAGIDDKIYLIKHGDNGLDQATFAMNKMDLLYGDAKNLASALFAYDGGDKMDCALKAAATIAATVYLANSQDYVEAQTKGENPELAHINVETPSGAQLITIQGSKSGINAVDIAVDGKAVATLPINTLINRPYQEYGSQIRDLISGQEKDTFTFGKSGAEITIRKTDDGVLIHASKEFASEIGTTVDHENLGIYKFENEGDVLKLAGRLFNSSVYLGEPESVAYAIAMVSNPEMQPVKNEDGTYLNPFRGEHESPGKAHVYLEHTEKGVSLKMFSPRDPESWDTLKINGWKSFNSLSSKDMMSLIDSVSEARNIIGRTDISVQDYDRQLEAKESKGDYFDTPIVGDQTVAEDMRRVHAEKMQFDHYFEDKEFVIPEGMEDVVKGFTGPDNHSPQPILDEEEIDDPYMNVTAADITPEEAEEYGIPEANEEEMVNYEPGVPDLDECDR